MKSLDTSFYNFRHSGEGRIEKHVLNTTLYMKLIN